MHSKPQSIWSEVNRMTIVDQDADKTWEMVLPVHGLITAKQAIQLLQKGMLLAIQEPFIANFERNECILKENLWTSVWSGKWEGNIWSPQIHHALAPGFSAMVVPCCAMVDEHPKIINSFFGGTCWSSKHYMAMGNASFVDDFPI